MSEAILPLTTVVPKGQDGKIVPGESEMELCCHPTYVKVKSLTVLSDDCGEDTIFPADKPFQVKAEIQFYGSGALALMALNVPMTFTFAAESQGPGPELNIANVALTTTAGVLDYTASAIVPANTLSGDILYRISMRFRMGAAGPKLSIANGYIDGILVEAYN